MAEVYKTLFCNSLYEISNYGNVRNISTKEIVQPIIEPENYSCVVYLKNEETNCLFARQVTGLIFSTFFKSFESTHFLRHINKDITDNRLDNLELITRYKAKKVYGHTSRFIDF